MIGYNINWAYIHRLLYRLTAYTGLFIRFLSQNLEIMK